MDQGGRAIEGTVPWRTEKSVLNPKARARGGEAQSFIWSTLLGQATLPVAFYVKPFGLIRTLLFSEINELNHLRTVAR